MLYVVATPIGNLEDITLRALETLKEVDFILAEDTRVTHKLLEHYGIDKKTISYHHHTDDKKLKELIELIKNNKVALVSDAGTPGISDPGGMLIKALNQESKKSRNQEIKGQNEGIKTDSNLAVVPIPGACAAITALSVSGFPTDEFLFKGFLPHKKGRQTFLREVLAEERTVVFYESCHRIIKCLAEIKTLIDADKSADKPGYRDKQLVVCRELTKKFESIYRGEIEEVLKGVKDDPVKGEYVLVIH